MLITKNSVIFIIPTDCNIVRYIHSGTDKLVRFTEAPAN